MIEFKRCNYITGDRVSDVSSAVSKIIDFIEMDGKNTILFHDDESSLRHFISNKRLFKGLNSIIDVISERGVLFRVDLIILDFWGYNTSGESFDDVKKYLDTLNIDYLIVAKKYHYKSTDNICDYHITYESGDIHSFNSNDHKYIITNKITNWSSSLSDCKKSYIRDKKIGQIFDKDDG